MPAIAKQQSNEPSKTPAKTEEGSPTKGEESYLGSWKTKEAAEEGVGNMKTVMDSQGNELGSLRKTTELLQRQIDSMDKAKPTPKAKANEPKPTDYGKEMAAVQKTIADLDPDEPGYQENLASAILASNQLVAKQASETTLNAAQTEFKKVLEERDVVDTHKNFYRDHPDFNDPEMQVRIQEHVNNDPSGMADPLSAYWEIKADDTAGALTTAEEDNAEMRKLLDLKEGESATGKVVTKDQGSQQQKTKQPKATGADLDKGMQGALDALRT